MQVLAVRCTPSLQRPVPARRSSVRVCAQKQPQNPTQAGDVVDDNIGEYCSLDKSGRRPTKEMSTGEKEQLFLDAMASFYYEDTTMLSDAEFDNLKQELQWEGSKVVVLSKDEQRLLEANLAFKRGKPLMGDVEYDALKAQLAGSGVFSARAEEGPVCSLERAEVRGQQKGEAQMDWAKMVALRLPALLAVSGTIALTDAATGGAIAHLPSTMAALFWGGIVVPSSYIVYNAIASFTFTNPVILKAACPNCGEVNTTYFGDILTVEGPKDTHVVKCPCCESKLTFDANQKAVIVKEVGATA